MPVIATTVAGAGVKLCSAIDGKMGLSVLMPCTPCCYYTRHQTPDTKTLRSCRVPGSLVTFPVLIGFRKIQQLLGQRTSGKIIVAAGQIFDPVLLVTVHAGRISVPKQNRTWTLYPHRRQIQYDAKFEKHLARRPNNDKQNSAASTHECPARPISSTCQTGLTRKTVAPQEQFPEVVELAKF